MRMFIYALFDPRTPAEIRYVGVTENVDARMNTHRSGRDESTGEWVKTIPAPLTVSYQILEITDDLNAHAHEARWIAKLATVHPLINERISEPSAFEFRVSPIMSLRDMEASYIQWTLNYFDGNKLATAKALGIGRQTLYNKLATLET